MILLHGFEGLAQHREQLAAEALLPEVLLLLLVPDIRLFDHKAAEYCPQNLHASEDGVRDVLGARALRNGLSHGVNPSDGDEIASGESYLLKAHCETSRLHCDVIINERIAEQNHQGLKEDDFADIVAYDTWCDQRDAHGRDCPDQKCRHDHPSTTNQVIEEPDDQ